MSDEDRRIEDARWKGETTQILKAINAKLDIVNGRLNDHASRLGALERWKAYILGIAAAVGGFVGWMTGGHK